MTLVEFIRKYDGKFVEVGGSANAENQCVDLVNAYLVEVLNKPKILGTNARDFPLKLKSGFDWIINTTEAIAKPGDIIVWQHNKWGHIAICVEAKLNWFKSFDQNYPTGTSAHLQEHNYLNPKVVGWLRPKKKNMPDALQECLRQHKKLVTEANQKDKKIIELESKLRKCQSKPVIIIPDPKVEWELNGKTETYEKDGKTIVLNYMVKRVK